MNKDRLKFRAPYFKNNEFYWLVYFEAGYECKKPSDHGYLGEREQCTGLKDKNGRLIFEGDIIKKPYNQFYEYSIHVISWEDGVYTTKRCLAMKDKKSGELINCSNGGFCFSSHITQDLAYSFEVIGNIHENPELLK